MNGFIVKKVVVSCGLLASYQNIECQVFRNNSLSIQRFRLKTHTILKNKKLLNYSVASFRNFKLVFVFSSSDSIIHGYTISLPFRKLHGLYQETIISSKKDSHNGSKTEKRSYGKIKNNKTILKILPFIRILYLKQQSSFCHAFLG